MIKHFYSYHVETDSLILEISALEIEEHEKKHLINLAESQIHHSIMSAILSELSKEDKKAFLTHINSRDHERIWKFLNNRVQNVETKIQEAAVAIKKELHKDIRDLKTKKES